LTRFPSAAKAAPHLLSLTDGLKSVRENASFGPSGLNHFPPLPRARALGCTLPPLRGYEMRFGCHLHFGVRVLTQTLKPISFKTNKDQSLCRTTLAPNLCNFAVAPFNYKQRT